jgi:hypothetical protein
METLDQSTSKCDIGFSLTGQNVDFPTCSFWNDNEDGELENHATPVLPLHSME